MKKSAVVSVLCALIYKLSSVYLLEYLASGADAVVVISYHDVNAFKWNITFYTHHVIVLNAYNLSSALKALNACWGIADVGVMILAVLNAIRCLFVNKV